MEEEDKYGITIIVVGLAILFACVGLSFVLARPLGIWHANVNRDIIQHSNSYIQSQVTSLTDDYSNYFELDAKKAEFSNNPDIVTSYTAQQNALVIRMCNTYSKIPNDIKAQVVPDYIQSFLSGKCD